MFRNVFAWPQLITIDRQPVRDGQKPIFQIRYII